MKQKENYIQEKEDAPIGPMDQLRRQSSIMLQFRHHLDRHSFGSGSRTGLSIQTFECVDCNRQVIRYTSPKL